jgi:hypothetical protein
MILTDNIRVKNKSKERVYLDKHPLVRFINTPMSEIFITDGISIRTKLVDVKSSTADLIDRLKCESNIKNKMFVVYAPCENTVFSNITYDPCSFEPVRYIRYAEIELTASEWKYLYKDKLKKREELYQDYLFNENKRNKNYNYLLIGR